MSSSGDYSIQTNAVEAPAEQQSPPTDDCPIEAPAPDNASTAVSKPSPVQIERMPSAKSPPSQIQGQFGVVSSTGQLVCEFRNSDMSSSSSPPPPSSPPSSPPPPSEVNIINTPQTPPPTFEPKSLGGTVSPTPQPVSEIEVETYNYEQPEKRTMNLSSIDTTDYPEVYNPAAAAPPPHEAALPEPVTLPPQDQKLTPVPPYYSTLNDPNMGYIDHGAMDPAQPTVTPLHLLGDQSDMVDCPFCMRRVETRVQKKASNMTHIWGTVCLLTTLVGIMAPYCCNWYSNVEHHCKNCKRKVAQKQYNQTEFQPLGTRPEFREPSRCEPPEQREKRRWRP